MRAILLALLIFGRCTHSSGDEPNVLRSPREIHQLSRADAARKLPVDFTGIVTYCDPVHFSCYVEDTTGGVFVRYPRTNFHPRVGQSLQIIGVTEPYQQAAMVRAQEPKYLGSRDLPVPRPVGLSELAKGNVFAQRVVTEGTVRRISRDETGAVVFLLMNDKATLPFRILNPDEGRLRREAFYGARIRVTGVVQPTTVASPDSAKGILKSVSFDELEILAPGFTDPDAIGLIPLDRLPEYSDGLIRLRGVIREGPLRDRAILRDQGMDVLLLNDDGLPPLRKGDRAEAVGFAGIEGGKRVLKFARVTVLDREGRRYLHDAFAIKSLRRELAAQNLPVRLRGIVTFTGHSFSDLFLQDATGAVYVAPQSNRKAVRVGDLIELDGITEPGTFSPNIRNSRFEIVQPVNLPAAREIFPDDVTNGLLDASLVTIDGVVRSIDEKPKHTQVHVATRYGNIDCRAPRNIDLKPYINYRVRLTGVFVASFRLNTTPHGFRILISSLDGIHKLDRKPIDLESAPLRSVASLFDYDPRQEYSSPFRVRGTVTNVVDAGTLILQDRSGGLRVVTRDEHSARVGEVVEAVGFVQTRGSVTELGYAGLTVTEETSPLRTAVMTIDEFVQQNRNHLLSIVEARISEIVEYEGRIRMTLQQKSHTFEAFLPKEDFSESRMRRDSVVRLTGVLVGDGDRTGGTSKVHMLLRNADDFELLVPAKWWTTDRLRTVVGVGIAIILLGFLGLVWLRIVIRIQRLRIRDQVVREARLEDRTRALVENANDMIFELDPDGRITSWNKAGEQLLGRPREQVIGRPLAEIVAPRHANCAATMPCEAQQIVEIAFLTREGVERRFEVGTRPVTRDGRVVACEAIARDITERERLHDELRHATKLQAVGQLAGGVAHDFNNLLTVINGNCEMVLRSTPDDDHRRPMLEDIQSAGVQAADVTRQLLAFSRKTVMAPKRLQINEILLLKVRVLSRLLGESIRTEMDLDHELPTVRLDPSALDQMILNLSVNARDAMPKGGSLTFRTKFVNQNTVRFEIADTGIGMSPETLTHIFEPYFTTKPMGHGTGLGLAMVQGFVEQSGGTITVESRPNGGTTFRIDFPAAEGESPSISEEPKFPSPTPDDNRTPVIFLVEDETTVLLLEKRILSTGNYHVISAESAEEALNLISLHREQIDLLITDVVMPGMNGRELAEEIMRNRPDIRCLFLSGYTRDEVFREGLLNEDVHFLQKPFTPSAFLKKVREILG